jgi:Gluconate 2-dehydrogenase subunit 3
MAYDRKQAGHDVAQANRPDYRILVGRAEIAVGDRREFAVLDPARAAVLKAWVATLIPAHDRRPDAAGVGAAEYVDATVHKVPALRPALLQAIDRLGGSFPELSNDARESLLRELEAQDPEAFGMVRDFTYEAYYGHPTVLEALEAETGWRGKAPIEGSELEAFDESALGRVKTLPQRWKQAGGASPAPTP